jgi:hypothetical protein
MLAISKAWFIFIGGFMDPISITCIVVAGGIVITSMGRFISKKYHSYKISF